VLTLIALRRGSRVDRIWVAGGVFLATAGLFPHLLERTQVGFEPSVREEHLAAQRGTTPQTDATHTFHRVMAGRTGRVWPLVLPNLLVQPLIGQGLYSVWKPPDPNAPRLNYNHPHNAYLEVALDMGVVGLAALAFLLWWFWKIGRVYAPFRYLVAAWALTAVTGDSFYPQLQNALNWSVLGMGVAAAAISESAAESEVLDESIGPE
jgi:O-antigen ligase